MKKIERIMVFGVLLISVILLSAAITYAFFVGNLGEIGNEVVKVQAGTMTLVFSDNDTLGNIERTLNFGDTVEKELKIENSGTIDAYAKISWDNLVNTFLEGSLTFTLDYKTGESEEWESVKLKDNNVPTVTDKASKVELVDGLLIPSGKTYFYRIIMTYNDLDIDQTSDLSANFSTKFTLDEGSKAITAEKVLSALNIQISKINNTVFDVPATTDETKEGLFSLEDDYGTSYYYRGAVENNYVKFGKNKNNRDMYWRIIRFNGDGSMRIMYDGLKAWANGTVNDTRYALTNVTWNEKTGDIKYCGWMFGGEQGKSSTSKEEAQRNETESDIKKTVDAWYLDNVKNTDYSKYLSDEIFCNDRTTDGDGFGAKSSYYGAHIRLGVYKYDEANPSFKCIQQNDMFTLKDDIGLEVFRNDKIEGNKALDYPVGLITADEISAAGGKVGVKNSNYYLYKSATYSGWSFSPYGYNSYGSTKYSVYTDGTLKGVGANNTDTPFAASPVINIAPEYAMQLKGQGTMSDPYYLDEH